MYQSQNNRIRMNSSIIFLDFDGVLNAEQYQARLAMDGKPTRDAWGPLFAPRAVANLRRIIDETDAAIVISSSWRNLYSLESLRIMWNVRDLPGEIFDAIPCGTAHISRGDEIECWLSLHRLTNYVIIDDVNDFYPMQQDRYVETNSIVGISEADAMRAVEILNLK